MSLKCINYISNYIIFIIFAQLKKYFFKSSQNPSFKNKSIVNVWQPKICPTNTITMSTFVKLYRLNLFSKKINQPMKTYGYTSHTANAQQFREERQAKSLPCWLVGNTLVALSTTISLSPMTLLHHLSMALCRDPSWSKHQVCCYLGWYYQDILEWGQEPSPVLSCTSRRPGNQKLAPQNSP